MTYLLDFRPIIKTVFADDIPRIDSKTGSCLDSTLLPKGNNAHRNDSSPRYLSNIPATSSLCICASAITHTPYPYLMCESRSNCSYEN